MTFRRFLLISMMVALGLCALVGVLAVFTGSGFAHEQVLVMAIATAVATGLLLPMTWLTSRERLRAGGLTGMAVVLICWLCVVALCWLPGITRGPSYRYEDSLLSTVGFTLLTGLPTALVLLTASFRWARVAVFTFVGGAAAAYLLCEIGVLFEFDTRLRGEPFLQSGVTLLGMNACASALLVNLGCGDKRHFRWAGVVAAAAATALFLVYFWGNITYDPSDLQWWRNQAYWHGGTKLLAAAVVMAHINLVLMAKLRRSQQWLQWGTIATSVIAGIAAICALGLTDDRGAELALRGTSGAGIVAGCGSLALIVLSVMNRKMDAAAALPGALEATAMDIVCPRCHMAQQVEFGESTCKSCDLRFSIKVTEPRCVACGYLLYRLTGDKCPECGAPLGAVAASTEHAKA